MDKGWIKLHRSLRKNPFMKKPAYRSVWIELLLEANHEKRDIIWKGKRITINPGQFTCGAKQISASTGVPRGTVERIMKCFKNEEQIEIETSPVFSLITIKNWHLYQTSEEQNEEQMRNERGTDEERMRTPKECKNETMKEIKKERHIDFLLDIPDEVIKEFSKEFNVYEQGIRGKAKDLYNYCKAKGKLYKDYKAFLRNAVKKDFGLRPIEAPKPWEVHQEVDRGGLQKLQEMKKGLNFSFKK